MIRSGLKLYRDNIFETFAIIGIVSIGVLIGILIVAPAIYGLVANNVALVASAASNIPGYFSKDTFLLEITRRFNALDWANPIRTIKVLLEQDGLLNIITESLKAANFDMSQLSLIMSTVQNCISTIINGFTNQAAIFIAVIAVFGIASYILTRIFIKIRSTSNNNVLKFILSIILNTILLCITFLIIGLCIYNLDGPILYVVLILSLIGMLIVSLLVSILVYRSKNTKFLELFNFKTILLLLLSSLIVLSISIVIIIPILVFSELISLLISIPLLIVTNIVIENITINYVTEFDDRKKKKLEKTKIIKNKKEVLNEK